MENITNKNNNLETRIYSEKEDFDRFLENYKWHYIKTLSWLRTEGYRSYMTDKLRDMLIK